MTALHEAKRPATLEAVAGQSEAVAALERARPWGGQAFWITGASGTGKTTLAKIIAADVASEWTTYEQTAGTLTPAGVREMEERYAGRSLMGGYCILVNECHGLRRDTVRALLDTLERLPDYVCWVFTTTNEGQASFFEDDAHGDCQPLVSRCTEVRLRNDAKSQRERAQYVKAAAMEAGCDGMPLESYVAAMSECKGNTRQLFGRVKAGQLEATAAGKMAAPKPKPKKGDSPFAVCATSITKN